MGENGTTNPDGVFSFSWGIDLNLHLSWGKVLHFLFESLWDTIVHGRTTRHDHVFVEVSSDIDITFHDGFEGKFVHLWDLSSDGSKWVEEGFWASELLVTNGDDVSVREFVLLFLGGGVFVLLHFFLEVKGDVTELLLDVSDDFELGRGGESGSAFSEDLSKIPGEVSSGEIVSFDGVWKGVTFVDWDGMGNTITRVDNATSDSTGGVEREDGLDSDVELGSIEVLEEDLDHSFSVLLWVSGGFSKEGTLVIRRDAKLFVIAMMPDFFHIIPVVDDTVLDGVVELENTSFLLGFFSYVAILLFSGGHDGFLFGVSDDGWE